MTIITKIKIIFFCCITIQFSFGQDIHFSQFYNSPLVLNPANTGNFLGEWRVMNHYRNQWMALPKSYQTISIGADKLFYYYNDVIGAGAYIVNDNSGAINLNVNKIYISGSYKKYLYDYYICGGIQLGYVNKTVDFNAFTFPSQYDQTIGNFNLQMNNNEINNHDQASYLDVNTGFLGITTYKKMKIEAGIAFYHINLPRESFTGGQSQLPVRTVLHSTVNINISNLWFVKPQILYMMHKKANDLILGSDIGIKVPDNSYRINIVQAGCYFRDGYSRNADAFILTLGTGWNRFLLGVSYDFNFAIVKSATGKRGSFEISLIYTSFNTIPRKITIPCNQY